MAEKKRLDVAMAELGLAESRQKAQALIMAGLVYIDNVKQDKAGTPVKEGQNIEVRGKGNPFVSRGGLKLDKAVKCFGLNLDGKICMDVGASTGGFSDCMLQNGAVRVYAVDVGYGQLAWKLRSDERVVNLERTNIRNLTKEQIGQELDFSSVDVSFISLRLVLPVVRELLRDGGQVVCLIKPQFEAGKEKVGKNGVVRDPEVHASVIEEIRTFMLNNGFSVLGLDFSPVKGPEGNIEYLIYGEKSENTVDTSEIESRALAQLSHERLGG